MHLHDALELFVQQLQADGRSAHTVGQYKRHVRAFARWAADVGHSGDVAGFTHQDVARFLNSDHARQRPDGGRKRETSTNALRTSTRVFWRYVHEAGLAPSNPARLVRRARCAPPPPRGLSEDDQRRLLDALATAQTPEERRDRALFELMLATGMRVGSAVAIDIADVDLDAREIVLRCCKGGGGQRVFVPDAVVQQLRGLVAERTGAVFVGRGGRRLSVRHVQRRLAIWLRRGGVVRPASCHGLRHAVAQRLYARTGDILLVQAALGHQSIASSQVYARPEAARVRQALLS